MTCIELTSVGESKRYRLFWNIDIADMSCHDIPRRRNHHYDECISMVSHLPFSPHRISFNIMISTRQRGEERKTWLRWLWNEKLGSRMDERDNGRSELLRTKWLIWLVEEQAKKICPVLLTSITQGEGSRLRSGSRWEWPAYRWLKKKISTSPNCCQREREKFSSYLMEVVSQSVFFTSVDSTSEHRVFSQLLRQPLLLLILFFSGFSSLAYFLMSILSPVGFILLLSFVIVLENRRGLLFLLFIARFSFLLLPPLPSRLCVDTLLLSLYPI